MTLPISTFEEVWAEIGRDPANQLAQIDSIASALVAVRDAAVETLLYWLLLR
jgi:hypothetical protein